MMTTTSATKDFEEKIVQINRVSKKTKGGNQIGFTALVVVGNRQGQVGVALGKANDVVSAIKKGVRKAKKNLIQVPLVKGTLPYQMSFKYKSAHVLLKPAPLGTGVLAGGAMRPVLELAGLQDVVAKMLGSNNRLTNVYATFEALKTIASLMATKKALQQVATTQK